jgi:hypothetical protein
MLCLLKCPELGQLIQMLERKHNIAVAGESLHEHGVFRGKRNQSVTIDQYPRRADVGRTSGTFVEFVRSSSRAARNLAKLGIFGLLQLFPSTLSAYWG